MKNKFYILLFSFFVMALFYGCKKYPEGPEFSFRTKRERVTGQWTVKQFYVNGADSISQLSCDYLYFYPDRSDPDPMVLGCADGAWGFENNKKDVFIILDGSKFLGIIIATNRILFQIQRLTNDEMWLKSKNLNKEYFIKFYKFNDW